MIKISRITEGTDGPNVVKTENLFEHEVTLIPFMDPVYSLRTNLYLLKVPLKYSDILYIPNNNFFDFGLVSLEVRKDERIFDVVSIKDGNTIVIAERVNKDE